MNKGETFSEEQLKELKEKHGKLFKLSVDGIDVIIKDIDRKTFSAVTKLIEKDELKAVEFMLDALTVAGDKEALKSDWRRLLTVSQQLTPLISPKEGNLGEV